MKESIHPTYEDVKFNCVCGFEANTRSTKGDITVEICSHCHPFYTGKHKLVDTAGRIEKFRKKYGNRQKKES